MVGAGQSALESAALLHEKGAERAAGRARRTSIRWNGAPLALDRPLLQRLKEPESGLGSGWATWFYSNHPGAFRHLPRSTRVYRARTALGPAGASWLREPGGRAVPGPDRPVGHVGEDAGRRRRGWGSPAGTAARELARRPRDGGHRLPAPT